MVQIQAIIEKAQQGLSKVSKQEQNKLFKKLDIETMEKAQYFDLNSQMFAMGKIDLSVSQFIYNGLRDYDSTSLAQRIVIMKLLSELATMKLRARGL